MTTARRALVTGSTSGIGRAIAERLVAAGYEVIVHGRVHERAERIKDKIGAAGELAADLSTPGGVEFAAQAVEHFKIDVLVNNAAQLDVGRHRLLNTSWAKFERQLAVNAGAGHELARAALPGMLERDAHGRIVWISSEGALMPGRELAAGPYLLSKWAALELSRLYAAEAAHSTVTSNALIVGPTRTETTEALARAAGMTVDQVVTLGYPGHLAGGAAEPGEVADVAAFLASPASIAFRGAVLRAEGGSLPTMLP